jgi:hypothetical protein
MNSKLMLFHLWLYFLVQLRTHKLILSLTILQVFALWWSETLMSLLLRKEYMLLVLWLNTNVWINWNSFILIVNWWYSWRSHCHQIGLISLDLTLLANYFVDHCSINEVKIALRAIMMNQASGWIMNHHYYFLLLLLIIRSRQSF